MPIPLRHIASSGDIIYIRGTILSGPNKFKDLEFYDVSIECIDAPVPVTTDLLFESTTKQYRDTDVSFDPPSALAYNIRSTRQLMNESQSAIAEWCGVRQATVSAWEQGLAEPRIAQLWKLAKFFDCSMEDLLT